MMTCSLAWSTSVTKSLTCFCEMRTASTSRAARLMMAPAARAALTATLSMGCRLGDDILDCGKNGGIGPLEATLRSGDAGGENQTFYRLRRLVSPNPAMRTRFILIQTSHAGNVGAAARAMKTMGFDD